MVYAHVAVNCSSLEYQVRAKELNNFLAQGARKSVANPGHVVQKRSVIKSPQQLHHSINAFNNNNNNNNLPLLCYRL
jgi:hypothetical protein